MVMMSRTTRFDPTVGRGLQLTVTHQRPAATVLLSSEIPVNNRPSCRVVKHRSDIQRAEPTGPHHEETVHCFSRICFNDCNASAVRQVVPTADLFKAMGLLNCSIIVSCHTTKSSKRFHLLPMVNFPLNHKQHLILLEFGQGASLSPDLETDLNFTISQTGD